jgi:predicted nucleotidyltransferase
MILFGSYALGSQRHDSDIDVVAMTPKEWQAGDSMIADYARNGEVV